MVALATILWVLAYANLTRFADALLALTGLLPQTHLGGALQFFFYDTPKVLLLTGIVFVMGIVHTFVSPERSDTMKINSLLNPLDSTIANRPQNRVHLILYMRKCSRNMNKPIKRRIC